MVNKKLTFIILLIFLVQQVSLINLNFNPNLNTNSNSNSLSLKGQNTTNSTFSKANSVASVQNAYTNPIIDNGYVRNGSSFERAINIPENISTSGNISKSNYSAYFRYYAQYPYDYVNVTVLANDTSYNMTLYDQFFNPIVSNTNSNLLKIISIPTSHSPLNASIRFIGWYYIRISTTNRPIEFNISIQFVKGDGSSLWSPIHIKPGKIAWNGIFKDMENSGSLSGRDSTFYSFNVNTSDPQISFQVSPSYAFLLLYDPDWTFIYRVEYGQGSWLSTKPGFYYLEVVGPNLINKNVTLSLSLQPAMEKIGDTFDQPIEIARSQGLTDVLTARPKYLKLYLYIGENVSINIGNSIGNNYSVAAFGPWGLEWFKGLTNLHSDPLILNNVENTGFYIFEISGPIGPYQVKLHFEYKIKDGFSWESAKSVNFTGYYSDHHYLFTNASYYYRINFNFGDSLNISVTGFNIKNATVLGKYRQIIGYINVSSTDPYAIISNITDSNYIYIQVNPDLSYSNFTLLIQKFNKNTSTLHVDGTLLLNNTQINIVERIPLMSLYLTEYTSIGKKLLGITSTNDKGYFSLDYGSILNESDPNFRLTLSLRFIGPALQLFQAQPLWTPYDLSFNLNKTSLESNIHLGQFFIPQGSWSFEVAHIFSTITKGWLFAQKLDQTSIGPQQIHVYYSLNSAGTYYIPYDNINGRLVKYVIHLLGYTMSDDDGWDSTVMLHEYGHHIEQTYAITDNPGGEHFFNSVISPDLGHGEGFPTFFASAVLNSSIYRDTNVNGYEGFNLATGRISSTTNLNNTLEDLFGPYGESSVFSLYYDLLNGINANINGINGINASVKIPVDKLFNIFFNFRNKNGLGVTNTNDVYQALILEFPSLIDNISEVYYDHGNGFYAHPFIIGGSNKTVASNDINANFTWELYDSNPKSYQIFLDSKLLKTGQWNFTEEVLVLNISQFNFTVGSVHIFILKLNDTLDNQRVYTFIIKIISKYNLEGSNFLNSININPNSPMIANRNNSTYYQYLPDASGIIQLSYSAIGYNLSVYNQNYILIEKISNFDSRHSVYLKATNESMLYLVFNYLSGSNPITLDVNNNPNGFSITNPLLISNPNNTSTISEAVSSTYYIKMKTGYTSRLFHIFGNANTTLTGSIFDLNNTLLKKFSINTTKNELSYVLPLNLMPSDVRPFNPFNNYIVVLTSTSDSIKINSSMTMLQVPDLIFKSPTAIIKNTNQTLEFVYSGVNKFTYTLNINNQIFSNGTITNFANNSYLLVIPITDLQIGNYVVDVQVIDGNGLINYFQFYFSIIPVKNSTHSLNEILIVTLILGMIVILVVIGITSILIIDHKKGKKITSKLPQLIRFKKEQ